jgi:hypothetical protein
MTAIIYHIVFGLSSLIALIDWRIGVILCMMFDSIRDPVRKITPEYPLVITLTIAGLWVATFMGALMNSRPRLRLASEFYPQNRIIWWSLVCALIPAALVSLVSYSDGWLLAAIGIVSYTFPIVGVVVGLAYVRRGRDMLVPLVWYCLTNGVILVGAYLEFMEYPYVGLRGMGVHWVRHQWGYSIKLISGYYRSPDLLGLHAAHVLMFTTILMMRSRTHFRWIWAPLCLYSSWCLLICGRRKMIVMPLFFFLMVLIQGIRSGRTTFAVKAGAAMAVVAALLVAFFPSNTASDYMRFAETSKSESWDRLSQTGFGGFFITLQQSGILGHGLGTATQGGRQVATHTARTWQEDGITRIAAEFGLPGSFFVFCALYGLGRCMWKAIRVMPGRSHAANLQIDFLGVVAANAASFAISHQAYSGDPSAIAIASMCLGFVLAVPLLGEEAREAAILQNQARNAPLVTPAPALREPASPGSTIFGVPGAVGPGPAT